MRDTRNMRYLAAIGIAAAIGAILGDMVKPKVHKTLGVKR
jgi:hypothetical protein